MERYAPNMEVKMKLFYDNLSEKDKRHYAAVESEKLGYGGMQYISGLFGCSRQTISKGLWELEQKNLLQKEQIRKPGGGRKSYKQKHPDINALFFKSN
jgi:predicted transcriptional regulator